MYEVTCRCRYCGEVHTGTIKRKKDPNPPCPNLGCADAARAETSARLYSTESRGEAVSPIEFDPAGGKAPSVGGSMKTRAVDFTAETVMQTYGMTDLKDNIREGEAMAPKLPPEQQYRADNFFGGGSPKRGSRMPFNAQKLGAQALRGAFSPATTRSPDPVALTHQARLRPAMTEARYSEGQKPKR